MKECSLPKQTSLCILLLFRAKKIKMQTVQNTIYMEFKKILVNTYALKYIKQIYAKYNFIYAGLRGTVHMPMVIPEVTLLFFIVSIYFIKCLYVCLYICRGGSVQLSVMHKYLLRCTRASILGFMVFQGFYHKWYILLLLTELSSCFNFLTSLSVFFVSSFWLLHRTKLVSRGYSP